MIENTDVQWWLLEAQQHPDSTADLIRTLAERVATLSRQNEELRGDLIALRRKSSSASSAEVQTLQARIKELEQTLHSGQRSVASRAIVYQPGRIVVSRSVDSIGENGLGAVEPGVTLLIADESARLLAVTADSRAFTIALRDLPIPESQPIAIDTPRGLIAFLDLAVLERRRYLTLISQRGYVYSVLAGAVVRLAVKQEPLIRNLIPDDPIVAAIPSGSGDLVAVSRLGRWMRFPERSIAGSGSVALTLPKGDMLAGITALDSSMLAIIFTADGEFFLRAADAIPANSAPGKTTGMFSKGKVILGIAAGTPHNTLTILTRQGMLLNLPIERLPYRARSEESIPIPGLRVGDAVAAFMVR